MHISDKIMAEAWEIIKEYAYHRIRLQTPSYVGINAQQGQKISCEGCLYWNKHSFCDRSISENHVKVCPFYYPDNRNTDYV